MSRRVLFLASLTAILIAVPSFGWAAQEQIRFEYGTDRTSWFWRDQVNQQVGGPDAPGGATHRARFPSPQARDTLPVAVENGQVKKVSTLYFSLADRGVDPGATITRFTLKIAAESSPNEQPAFNQDGKEIQACRVGDFWPGGEAEEWDGRPDHDEGACVEGKSATKDGETTWTFNLTSVAEPWGEDPFGANNGVVFLPVQEGGGPQATWQVNLKIPSRNNEQTPQNEYDETKDRALVTLAFTPPAAEAGGLGSLPGGGDFGTGGSSSFFPSSDTTTDLGADTTYEAPVAEEVQEAGTDELEQAAFGTEPMTPQLPGYVWALIPIGLLALSGARSALIETVGGPRPDGAIAAIRRINGQRRGSPTLAAGPLVPGVWGARARARRALSTIAPTRWISTITRGVRKR